MWPFDRKKPEPIHRRKVRFVPKNDMTLVESLYVPGIFHLGSCPIGHVWTRDEYYEGLPDNVKRHFEEVS